MEYKDLIIKNADGTPREMLKVSRLCFGSLCLGHLQSDLDIEKGAEIIKRAYELGVNFFDTAQLYGTYKYIKAANFGDNDNIVISSKTYAHTRELAEAALEEALHELGRDYIDIFMLHEQESLSTIQGHSEALEYLFEQKNCGRIKAVGISTHHVSGVLGAIEFNANDEYQNYKLDIIHPMFNMAGLGIIGDSENANGVNDVNDVNENLKLMEAALLEAKKSGFFIFCMKALGGGVLYNKAEEALDFVLSKPYIDSVALGIKSVLEAEAGVKFFETGRFPEEYYTDYHKIKKSLHIDDWCTGCEKCTRRCTQGALYISDSTGKAACNAQKCVLCGYCAAVCGDFAIKII
jgi:aryl-alcohol dehydrogenase-like predicted oxidoreductase